jgi:pyruvate/2-oxoglutarate dehydrogenase complex dihydrolipoamide dehydrogenase (E3) component
MAHPVTLIGGTDQLQVEPDGRVYHVGDVIRDLPDYKHVSLQAAGVRFAAVHEDDPPPDPAQPEAVFLPPDQVAVNAEIAGMAPAAGAPATPKAAPKADAKGKD